MTGAGDLRRELERLRRLVDASYALHTTLDLDELLGLILDAAKGGVGAERGTVFLLTEDGRELWSRVSSGGHAVEIRLPVGQGIAGTVAADGVTVNLADAYTDPRFDRSWDRQTGYRTKELLTAPIRNRDREIVGVFQLLGNAAGPFGEEDERFLELLSVHAALAIENARLHRAALEKERQDRDIRLAQGVQRAYQPERLEASNGAFAFAGLNVLCEHASGDYYDVFDLPDGRTVLAVGDVAGHGLGAALVMAQARALLHALLPGADDLSHLLARLNDYLVRDMVGGRFLSLFLAVADATEGTLVWNSAGHPPGLLVRATTGAVEHLDPQGLVLGILEGQTYAAPPVARLATGDTLLLYTDGATEAKREELEMLEEEGLERILVGLRDRDPTALVEGIRTALTDWTGVATFDDDVTLVAVQRR